jgi:hypothetical protein
MRGIALSTVTFIALLLPAEGVENGSGCEKFAWSLARERARFAAADKIIITAGDSLPSRPKGAVVMRLQPACQASFALPPERTPRSDGWFGGAVRFPAVERSGIYQVTLSDEAWGDVIRNGRFARFIGSSGRSDCPGLRKSVRLELGLTPFVLQFSGATRDAIVIAISPSE